MCVSDLVESGALEEMLRTNAQQPSALAAARQKAQIMF